MASFRRCELAAADDSLAASSSSIVASTEGELIEFATSSCEDAPFGGVTATEAPPCHNSGAITSLTAAQHAFGRTALWYAWNPYFQLLSPSSASVRTFYDAVAARSSSASKSPKSTDINVTSSDQRTTSFLFVRSSQATATAAALAIHRFEQTRLHAQLHIFGSCEPYGEIAAASDGDDDEQHNFSAGDHHHDDGEEGGSTGAAAARRTHSKKRRASNLRSHKTLLIGNVSYLIRPSELRWVLKRLTGVTALGIEHRRNWSTRGRTGLFTATVRAEDVEIALVGHRRALSCPEFLWIPHCDATQAARICFRLRELGIVKNNLLSIECRHRSPHQPESYASVESAAERMIVVGRDRVTSTGARVVASPTSPSSPPRLLGLRVVEHVKGGRCRYAVGASTLLLPTD
jgi:hypothetical protein